MSGGFPDPHSRVQFLSVVVIWMSRIPLISFCLATPIVYPQVERMHDSVSSFAKVLHSECVLWISKLAEMLWVDIKVYLSKVIAIHVHKSFAGSIWTSNFLRNKGNICSVATFSINRHC